jgi:peptide/nickel transport system substrate-binding protein
VRRAFSLAVDHEDLVQGLFAGHALPGTSPIVSALWAHDSSTALAYDPEQATSLLAEAGWRDTDGDGILDRNGKPLELRVLVNAENQVRRDALERVTQTLARIGARLIAEPVPRGEFASRGRFKNFDAILAGWVAGTRIEPQSILHTKAAADRGNNLTAWSTPDSDALLDRAAAAATREAAAPLWIQWQAIVRDEQPYTILYEEKSLLGLGSRVRGPTPSGLDPFRNLHQLWIEEKHP